MRYLIVYCGYEGIEEIVGIFNRKEAVLKIKHLRRYPGKYKKGVQYCVMAGCNTGVKCVCKKFDAAIKQTWFY